MATNNVRVGFNCDCGDSFQIPIGGVELETYEFSCPACGKSHRFSEEDINSIMAQYEAARAVGIEHARKSLREAAERATRGSKHIKYRPK